MLKVEKDPLSFHDGLGLKSQGLGFKFLATHSCHSLLLGARRYVRPASEVTISVEPTG